MGRGAGRVSWGEGMKTIESTYEWLVLVVAITILVVPEMVYFGLTRMRDRVEDCIGELY